MKLQRLPKITLCLLFLSVLTTEGISLIEHIEVHKNRLDIKINQEFKDAYLRDDFFIEYDEDIDLEKFDYSLVTLPFIMNVISLVWISGQEYEIESMDEEVYQSLERIKRIFKIFYPKTPWRGKLVPKKLVSHGKLVEHTQGQRCALLFSGGLDSTYSSLAHRDKPQLLITSWGQSALPLDEPAFWHKIKKRIVDFAQKNGHTNAFIKSNYYYFLNLKKLNKLSKEIVTWRIDTIEDIGWAGIAAPLLLNHGISTLHIASSDCWAFPSPSAANPFIDGNITFAGITIKHDQFELSRFDKILKMAHLRKHHLVGDQNLIICQTKGDIINCGACEKCLLTIIGLLAAHEDPTEYGFAAVDTLQKNMRRLLKRGKLSASGIWQFKDIQQKLPPDTTYDLSWFKALNFDTIRPYDAKNQEPLDWAQLEALFPAIKVPKNSTELL